MKLQIVDKEGKELEILDIPEVLKDDDCIKLHEDGKYYLHTRRRRDIDVTI